MNKEQKALIKTAQSFKDDLHKDLVLGMTRYQCRYGTLSDGHEKITPAQRYFQAIREMFSRGVEISNLECVLMEAQADEIDAEEALKKAKKESDKLRAKSALQRAKNKCISTKISIDDCLRQLDEFNKVREELKDEVKKKYPDGIEQAEPDNWAAVAQYRGILRQFGHNVNLTHIPMDQKSKARLGLKINAPDMAAWHMVEHKEELLKFKGDFKAYALEHLGDEP